MHQKEWFGVGTRLIGIWQLVIAAQYSISVIAVLLDQSNINAPLFSDVGTSSEYFLYAVAHALLGVALLRGADFLTALAYPLRREERGDHTADRLSYDLSQTDPKTDDPREAKK